MQNKYICVLDDTDLIPELCGYGDRNLKAIEEKLQVPVYCRGNEILLESDDKAKQELFSRVISQMRSYAQKGVSPDQDMIITLFNEAESGSADSKKDYSITIPGSSRRVFPRNKNQMRLIELFDTKDLVFAIGPAGTGKTYLAVA
ncbi:MAG: PhoH family protein, partial [Spirochaetia bacterium]|nr:PhoH family protein [Spirochaetia bacterium]